ncbi:MAG: methyltransferase domain-containing protein [Gammaproteobacteria bacterium]|nr:methyltransferase domain-containing protein [Gammaproteobacteria bacterium]
MSTDELKTFMATYDWAKTWRDLPWAHDEATLFLAELCAKRKPGRALDIGCGAGTDSVYLAQRGWEVTALDFIPKALEFTQARAREAGVDVQPVEADITAWRAEQPFDLVLDHGLLHNLDPLRHAAYRETVLHALADDGDFILLHWHPLFPGQGNGKMGPRRASREELQGFFAPDLQERFFAREEFEDLPAVVGGGMTQAYYWFRRNQAQLKPAVLMEQVQATFVRHKVDADGLLAAAGDAPIAARLAAPDLLGRLIGPGRLGITHQVPDPADAGQRLREWSMHAGLDPDRVDRLFHLFMSADHGDICGTAPKCPQCEVRFCKRLRHR